MKDRPILFSGPMVRAILEGRKTMTRRVIQYPRSTGAFVLAELSDGTMWPHVSYDGEAFDDGNGNERAINCPYGVPGDRLWVRETWQTGKNLDPFNATEIAEKCIEAGFSKPGAPIKFLLDGQTLPWGDNDEDDFGGWGRVRSSRFMPRWASRILLEITDVRVQRVQEITYQDCVDEGILSHNPNVTAFAEKNHLAVMREYAELWDSINSKRGYGWDANPWVWAVSFKQVRKEQSCQ